MSSATPRYAGPGLRGLMVAVAALALLGTAAPVLAEGGGGGGGGGNPPDFSICCNDSAIPGFLVLGGLATCPGFDNCAPNPSFEPRYFSCGFSTCGYGNAVVVLTSLNGFSGAVTLQLLNLPAGVTSQTATTVTLQPNFTTYTNFALSADTTAALGDTLVTVRATSGALVHDAPHLLRVVDTLPPPLLTPTFSPASVPGGRPRRARRRSRARRRPAGPW